ncbi:MAG: hypothetical protein JSS43_17270, partial [Proteobacteria bacterium]|nr:hypothetical protein [Pseudomonadota bacterium]
RNGAHDGKGQAIELVGPVEADDAHGAILLDQDRWDIGHPVRLSVFSGEASVTAFRHRRNPAGLVRRDGS